MKAIIGLGNPGKKYINNRHNVGRMVVERLGEEEGVFFKRSFKCRAYLAKAVVGETKVLLIKPKTFMNNSGFCLKKVLKEYKILENDCLVLYDDADLPLGILRFKERGSGGGHRGMVSIIERLGSKEINRLRIGIGAPEGKDLSDYVLSDFLKHEGGTLSQSISKAVSACRDWVNFGSAFVMNRINVRARAN